MTVIAVANLVHETSISTGAGNLTLAPLFGKKTFAMAFSTGSTQNVFWYFVSNAQAAEWELGSGHMSNSTTLVRDTIIESSNANAAVNFSAGVKYIGNDLPASFQTSVIQLTGGVDTSPGTTNKGLNYVHVGPNTGAASAPIHYNSIIVSDGAAVNSGTLEATPLYVQHSLASASKGQKYAIFASSLQGVATLGMGDQIAGVLFAQSSASKGGTNTTSGAFGSCIGGNSISDLESGATNLAYTSAHEFDRVIASGATVREGYGIYVANASVGQGAVYDAAIAIGSANISGSFKALILLSSEAATLGGNIAPLDASASLILGDGNAHTITNGFYLPEYTATGSWLNFGGLVILSGAGVLSLLTTQAVPLLISSTGTNVSPAVNAVTASHSATWAYAFNGAVKWYAGMQTDLSYVVVDGVSGLTVLRSASNSGIITFPQYGLGILHSSAAGVLSSSAVNLATADVTGNLPVANLNSGTGASSTTFWRGDGTWAALVDADVPLTNTHIFVGNASNVAVDVALSGDATMANTGALTLASVISAAGPIGGSTAIPVVTYDAKGRLTTVTTAVVISPAGTLSGTTLNATVVSSSLTSLGTITSLTATTINAFTLGGTVSGGGNQINNVIIGASTPLAGTFTTLSVTTSVIIPSITLGTASSVTGTLKFANASSANLTTIQAGNAANARTYTWPTDFGAAGTVLTDAAGNGTLSWASAAAAAGTLTGTTLASNVVTSSLTSVGTLTSLTTSGSITMGNFPYLLSDTAVSVLVRSGVGMFVGSGLSYGISSNANASSTQSVQLSLASSGVFSVDTGTSGNGLGSIKLTNLTATGSIRLGLFTVATLPGSPTDGMTAFVTDSTATIITGLGLAVVGSGSNHVPVFYDGGTSSWKVG
jgi:hypothetical protein